MSVAAALAVLGPATSPLEAQPSKYRAPRTADGRPDPNGIRQALNTANCDLASRLPELAPARRVMRLDSAAPLRYQ